MPFGRIVTASRVDLANEPARCWQITKQGRDGSGTTPLGNSLTGSKAGLGDSQTLNRGSIMIKFATSFLRDDSGASAAEYALILAIIGTGIALASITLGGAISTAMGEASDCIDGTDTTCRS